MARYPYQLAPLPSDDECLILDESLTSLPSAYVTSYPASGTKGEFTSDGYKPEGLGGTGRLGVTGIPNQAKLENGGFVAISIDTAGIAKDESLDPGSVTQSSGLIRVSNGVLISFWGDSGNAERIMLYLHSAGALTLYKFGTGAGVICQNGVTSVGKSDVCDLVWEVRGKLHIIYVDGAEIMRGVFSGNYDTNQFATAYVCGNGGFSDAPIGDVTVSKLQMGLRPHMSRVHHETIAIWADSFVQAGFGTAGGMPTYGVPQYDARMNKTVERLFRNNENIEVKIAGFGYSGYSWSNSNAQPQSDNVAAIVAYNPEILIMPNSVNGVHDNASLVSDYQSSLEVDLDAVIPNCGNLKKIAFTSMFFYMNNPESNADALTGVTEASNAVMLGLVEYVQTNYPNIEVSFFDVTEWFGGSRNYPPEWTIGYVDSSNNLHPTPIGHSSAAAGGYWYRIIKNLLY